MLLVLQDVGELLPQVSTPHQLRNACIGLCIGLAIFCIATYWIRVGRVWTRFHGWLYRDDDSRGFWWEVAMEYLIAIALIVYFTFKIFTATVN